MIKKSFFVLSLALFSTIVFAQKEIPELWGSHVHDEAHVLNQKTIDLLEKELKAYEDSTSNQVAILIISSLEGETIEDYSIRVAEKWKLGTKAKDNGVLLLIAADDHKMRIEVGQGLEGLLTDAQSNRIIRNEMAPAFRRSDYDAGVLAAIQAMIKAIGEEYSAEDSSDESFIAGGLIMLSVMAVFTLIALLSQGGIAWVLYLFLTPFYWIFSSTLGSAAFVVFGIYFIGFPIIKVLMNRSPRWKAKMMKWQSSRSSSGWNSGRGWGTSSGGGFSGRGGSFGGGGSSGGW
jgi:uncharacterized protein